MPMKRPSFQSAWNTFMQVRVPVEQVGKKIGGYVQKNTEIPGPSGFRNACPIRMSYVLNYTGFPIPKSPIYKTVSGADHKQYIYHIDDMMDYLVRAFGKPDKLVKLPKTTDFAGLKGIVVVRGHGWSDAKGHVTIWDGQKCSDICHLMADPDNGTFTPETAAIWVLQ
jgi:hypothetical protein